MNAVLAYVFILLVSFIPAPCPVYAVEDIPLVVSEVSAPIASSEGAMQEKESSAYQLPYPGILPDHPFYSMKKIRDLILEKLITDPVKKMEFSILQSDKDVHASIFLAEKSKNLLVQQALLRALSWKEKGISIGKTLKEKKISTPSYIVEKFSGSIRRQQEVHVDLKNSTDASLKKQIDEWDGVLKKLLNQVETFR